MEDLPRHQRLRGRERMGRLFQEGARATAGRVAVRALPNIDGATRVAAIAGKTLGNAVKRNRMRRLLRAAYRMQKNDLPRGWDFALVARPGFLEAPWRVVMRDVGLAMTRAVRASSASPRREPSI